MCYIIREIVYVNHTQIHLETGSINKNTKEFGMHSIVYEIADICFVLIFIYMLTFNDTYAYLNHRVSLYYICISRVTDFSDPDHNITEV